MARSRRFNGPTYTEHELSDPNLPKQIIARRPVLGEVDRKEEAPLAAGMDSSQSSGSKSQSSGKRNPSPRQPAHTTANLSNQQDKEVSDTARLTGTGGLNNPPKQSARGKRGGARFTEDPLDEFDDFD